MKKARFTMKAEGLLNRLSKEQLQKIYADFDLHAPARAALVLGIPKLQETMDRALKRQEQWKTFFKAFSVLAESAYTAGRIDLRARQTVIIKKTWAAAPRGEFGSD